MFLVQKSPKTTLGLWVFVLSIDRHAPQRHDHFREAIKSVIEFHARLRLVVAVVSGATANRNGLPNIGFVVLRRELTRFHFS